MTDKIDIKHSKEKVKVVLAPSHFSRQKLATIENYLDATVTLEENGFLTLLYDKPNFSYSLKDLIAEEMTEVKRLELAQKMESITFSEHSFKVPYIHPKNIFLQGSVIKILHYVPHHPYTYKSTFRNYRTLQPVFRSKIRRCCS